MSLADLKKKSKMGSLAEKLIKQVEKLNDKGGVEDERFWKPTMDKGGTGYAVIRFLPAREPEWTDTSVSIFSHAFQGPGGQWLIENCPTTESIGRKNCPICSSNSKLWATGDKEKQNIVRDRKRKLSYYSNIYVIEDPANPQNEGKVFLFKYGKKIFEKIDAAIRPKFKKDKSIDAFDPWLGADFELKICKVDGYWNYDQSVFAKPSPFLDANEDEVELEKVYNSMYNLNELNAPEKFKSNEELQKRLDIVLGNITETRRQVDEELDEETQQDYNKLVESKVSRRSSAPVVEDDEEEDEYVDNALDYFSKLASM